jgi:hypothetical protein
VDQGGEEKKEINKFKWEDLVDFYIDGKFDRIIVYHYDFDKKYTLHFFFLISPYLVYRSVLTLSSFSYLSIAVAGNRTVVFPIKFNINHH